MALHFFYYNFVRVHKTLRTTPAMTSGVTKRLWEMMDVERRGVGVNRKRMTNAIYYGDKATNGTWRIMRSGNDMVHQRREVGVYVTKLIVVA